MCARKPKCLGSTYSPFAKPFANFKTTLYNMHWKDKLQPGFIVTLGTPVHWKPLIWVTQLTSLTQQDGVDCPPNAALF